jgi:hypothetical protein
MTAALDPRLAPPESPSTAMAQTWRVLLSLPGRVGMVDPGSSDDLMRLARAAFHGPGAGAAGPPG